MTRLFFIVLARDRKHVDDKIRELETLGVPYKIICGKRLMHTCIVTDRAHLALPAEIRLAYDSDNAGISACS